MTIMCAEPARSISIPSPGRSLSRPSNSAHPAERGLRDLAPLADGGAVGGAHPRKRG
jgi:hypothetical protein